MSTEKGTYQAPAGAAVPVKGEVIATQPAETVHAASSLAARRGPSSSAASTTAIVVRTSRCAAHSVLGRPCLWAEAAEYLQVDTLRSPQDAECCQPCCCCTSARCATNYWVLMGCSRADVPGLAPRNAMGCQSISSMINLTSLDDAVAPAIGAAGPHGRVGHATALISRCFPCSVYQQGRLRQARAQARLRLLHLPVLKRRRAARAGAEQMHLLPEPVRRRDGPAGAAVV